jgi:hypothetical protein
LASSPIFLHANPSHLTHAPWGSAGAPGPRLVELSVVALSHLPKMDRIGTCDAYIDIAWLGHACRTTVRKDCLDPAFDEHFSFSLGDQQANEVGACSLAVKDWDMVGSENIGSVTLKRDLMQRIASAEFGWEAEHTFPLKAPAPQKSLFGSKKKKKATVVGHDGETCVLTLRVRVAALLDLREPPAGEGGGSRRLELSVVSLRHLPKMDQLGTCDAYVEVAFLGHRFRTSTREGSLNPDFHETFGFSIPDITADTVTGPCTLRVKDWDLGTEDDDIGEVILDEDLMGRIARAEIGWEGEHTFAVVADGQAVVGHDGSACELSVRVRVAALLAMDVFDVRCSDLPQTDLLGKSDPYCTITVGPEEIGRSETLKRSLNPIFRDWWCSHHGRSPKVRVEIAGTADREPDPYRYASLSLNPKPEP